MQIPLDAFEQHINGTILKRGLDYFRDGNVLEMVPINHGEFEFIVAGSENYTVRIRVEDGMIMSYMCNCPYDMGPVCKHLVAAIFHLQQDALDIRKKDPAKRRKHAKKRKTIADQVNELLELASTEDLQQFIREQAELDKRFRDLFLSAFTHLNPDASKSFYKKQVRSILRSAGANRGFIDWRNAGEVGLQIDRLLVAAERHVTNGAFDSAIMISSAIMEEMVKAFDFADDSYGDIGGSIQGAFDVIARIASESNEEQARKRVLEYCFEAFQKRVFEDWNWHLGLLELAAGIIQTPKEKEMILKLLDQGDFSGYELDSAKLIRYAVHVRMQNEEAAQKLMLENISIPAFRKMAIEQAMQKSDFPKAYQYALEGIEFDRENKPGRVRQWYNWLLKIAQKESRPERIIEYARHLFLDDFMQEQDYYEILKAHVEPGKWNAFVEGMIREITGNGQWASSRLVESIFVREKWWHRLLELVKASRDLDTIERNERYLAADYSEDLIEMYAEQVLQYMEDHMGRKHYENACRYLRRMIKLGGWVKANELVLYLRQRYSRRSALMQELDNV